jgi:hypothetical protein
MTAPGTSQTTLRDLLGNLRTGLLVVADELKWIVLRGLRSLEIRQMEKRLDEERAALGRSVAEAVAGQEAPASAPLDDAARLCLKQIAFLSEELSYLRAERERMRQDLLERRRATLAANDAAGAPQPSQPESPEE